MPHSAFHTNHDPFPDGSILEQQAKIYYISDEHYGDESILRSYSDNELIELNNSVVTDSDLVYHLGDFCTTHFRQLETTGAVLKELRGKHILIAGNHDPTHEEGKYMLAGFTAVVHSAVLRSLQQLVFLSHEKPCELQDAVGGLPCRYIHGHSHANWFLSGAARQCMCVSVYAGDGKPKTLPQLTTRRKKSLIRRGEAALSIVSK